MLSAAVVMRTDCARLSAGHPACWVPAYLLSSTDIVNVIQCKYGIVHAPSVTRLASLSEATPSDSGGLAVRT